MRVVAQIIARALRALADRLDPTAEHGGVWTGSGESTDFVVDTTAPLSWRFEVVDPNAAEGLIRDALASAFRDWIHESPLTQCSIAADTCPDWPLAYELADIALRVRANARVGG
jgi:hypothetical protein